MVGILESRSSQTGKIHVSDLKPLEREHTSLGERGREDDE